MFGYGLGSQSLIVIPNIDEYKRGALQHVYHEVFLNKTHRNVLRQQQVMKGDRILKICIK